MDGVEGEDKFRVNADSDDHRIDFVKGHCVNSIVPVEDK